MGSCTRRHFLLSTCFLQMITIIERQVFDFLGYMWAPIFVNFFHILFIIFGFYGAYHFRIKYIITYLIWSFLWIGWNAFLICFYLNVGTLDKDSDLLNLGTGSVSWFEVNGYGCKPTYPTNFTSEDPYRPIRPERVDDCLLTYDLVEVIHSGVQCALALLGILGAILISYIFLDEDDRFDFMNGDAKSPQHTVVHPMYVSYTSIPTSASATMLSTSNNKHINHHHLNNSNSNSNSYHLSTHHGVMQEQANYSPQQQQHKLHHKLHQYDQQQQNFSNSTTTTTNSNNKAINNGNTFLIHHHHNNHRATPNKGTSSLNSGGRTYLSGGSLNSQFNANNGSYSNRKQQKCNYSSRSNTPNASKTSTLTHMLYSPKQMRKIGSTTTSIFPAPTTTAVDLAYKQSFYDDSTAKADHQLYSNNSRHHFSPNTHTPTQDTTPSLSYASLQNSNQNLVSSLSGCGVAGGSRGGSACGGGVSSGTGTGMASPLSNSNYSLTNSLNNNVTVGTSNSGGHFARIHGKPKPPKSSSYSSFLQGGSGYNSITTTSSGNHVQRPDIKYTQISNNEQRLSNNIDEAYEEDNFSLQNFKTDEGITYVPFTKPTPTPLTTNSNYFIQKIEGDNKNPSYASIVSLSNEQNSLNNNSNDNNNKNNNSSSGSRKILSPNNNSNNNNNNNSLPFANDNAGILLERGAILQPASLQNPAMQVNILNPAQRILYQQNGLPFHPAYSPMTYRASNIPRPTNIPLPTIPAQVEGNELISPSDFTPPPPPHNPKPHIFQPRSGQAPYPDLSPEVAERYAMPTQYVPRSPVASRIIRRQRQQAQATQDKPFAVNFCDQIRDTPPGYTDNGYKIARAKSHDRLNNSQPVVLRDKEKSTSRPGESTPNGLQQIKDLAPHVNRRSGRRDGNKVRPRSYCNSMTGGEGVIRVNIATDRENSMRNEALSYAA
ncbi:sodium/potassium-transporting ATPase subunit beta-1-interacting protein isoform 2-T8 [Glossina fuscipes fuscipes]